MGKFTCKHGLLHQITYSPSVDDLSKQPIKMPSLPHLHFHSGQSFVPKVQSVTSRSFNSIDMNCGQSVACRQCKVKEDTKISYSSLGTLERVIFLCWRSIAMLRRTNLETKDVEGATETEPKNDSMRRTSFLIFLQISNISLWYWTNGMNGISMQSYASGVNTKQESTLSDFLRIASVTCLITCLQLLSGAIIGRLILLVINPGITSAHILSTHWLPLSMLHALGSLATNLGFMYGKASLVQVLKLLEPFETLLLSQLLFSEGNFSVGIVSSMVVVVGAAMSLLKLQTTAPNPLAIIFAIVSGLTLSCRNVLQRKHHHTNEITQDWSKLEKSVVQFTQLSLFSGMWTGSTAVICWLLIRPDLSTPSAQVLFWHPLYNIFSMITLGFCSALTHSLLNAGKRVFAICMAMLWFSEGLNPATLAGLFSVGVGGSWYSWECKRPRGSRKNKPEYHKLAVSVAALLLLTWFQQKKR